MFETYEDMVTIDDVCQMLNIGKNNAYRSLKEGKLHAFKIGRIWKISRQSVIEYVKPAILKATMTEIRICDEYNRLICRHPRSYRDFPLYITDDSHMPPEHLYYKEVNAHDGAYYRWWASVYGESMVTLIDRILRSSKHEEQAYNSCAGVLHSCMFADNTYADACLTRITDKHHTYRLEMSVFFSQNTSYNREIQISPVPISGSAIPVMIPFEYPQIGYLNLTISPNLYRSWM